jgi:ABC-type spermidine/putrescine transport system permease subunit II
MIRRAVLRLLLALTCAGLLAPIVIVVVLSFSGDAYLAFPPRHFTLSWYARFLGNDRWRDALLNSVLIAAGACMLATAIGFLASYVLVRARMPMKGAVTSLILMPLIVPNVITAVAIYFFSARLGLVGNLGWVAVAHSVIALPVVLLILQAALQGVDINLERAAMVHGCTRWGVFRRVVIPLALPGVVSAALFAFLTSFDDLVISLFLAGVRAETLPVHIWNSLTLQVEPTIAAVSTLLIAVTIVALLIDLVARRFR